MRKTTYTHLKKQLLIFLSLGFLACSANPDYKTTIVEFLETHKGVRTDLKIEFQSFEVTDILVSDSIKIYQDEFEAQKEKRIKGLQGTIERKKASIAKQENSKKQVVAKALINQWLEDVSKLESELVEIQHEPQPTLEKYDSRSSTDILAKKVKATFSFFNPQLQTKQEVKADFILSADGTKCNKMIK